MNFFIVRPLHGPDFGNGDVPVKPFWGVRFHPRRSGWVEVIVLCRPSRACLRLRSPRVHASVRGRRGGRQHDAGSMQFRCAHLIGVLRGAGNSPDHGIIGTASLGGPRRPAVRRASAGGPASQATFGAGPSERKSVPSTHMRCRMTPMRRASATIARFDPRRRAICAAHVLSQVERPRCIMTVAA